MRRERAAAAAAAAAAAGCCLAAGPCCCRSPGLLALRARKRGGEHDRDRQNSTSSCSSTILHNVGSSRKGASNASSTRPAGSRLDLGADGSGPHLTADWQGGHGRGQGQDVWHHRRACHSGQSHAPQRLIHGARGSVVRHTSIGRPAEQTCIGTDAAPLALTQQPHSGSPYEGGLFEVDIQIPPNYPFTALKMKVRHAHALSSVWFATFARAGS